MSAGSNGNVERRSVRRDRPGPPTSAVRLHDRDLPVAPHWEAFVERGEVEARDALIVHYLALVRAIARRLAGVLPSGVEVTDLVSEGTFGLVEAIERFDPSRGLAFSTFAVPRIRGAMVDALRAMDWAPRSVRAAARQIQEATVELESQLGRSPTEAELAERLGIDPEICHRLRLEGRRAALLHLEDHQPGATDDPLLATIDDEDRAVMAAALGTLPAREAFIVKLHDGFGVSLLELAGMLGISHSRAFQLHKRGIRLLRIAFDEGADDDEVAT